MNIATFDIETDGLLSDVTRVWCGCIKDHQTQELFTYTQSQIPHLLTKLETYDCIVGHFITGFDLPVLRKLYNWEPRSRFLDTLVISRLQRPDRPLHPLCPKNVGPHSIESWGYRVGRPKVQNDVWHEYSDIILERCKEDVEIQHLVYLALMEEGKGEGWESANRLTSKLFWILYKQEENGWTVDLDHMAACLDRLHRWISRIDRALASRMPLVIDILEKRIDGNYTYVRSPFTKSGDYASRVANFWNGSRWITDRCIWGPYSRIEIRPVSLDKASEVKELLLSLGWKPKEWNENNDGQRTSPKLSKDDPFVGIEGGLGKLIVRRVQCKQRRGTIEGWQQSVRPDGKISPTFSGLTTTARLRHSGIVNVPNPETGSFFSSWMRRIFIPRPGWVMIGCDSKGNQNRQLAARMGDENYTRAVLYGKKEDGTDEHTLNQRRAGLPSRTLAKNLLYGILFGAGDEKVATTIKQPIEKAREYKRIIMDGMPGLRDLLSSLAAEWRRTARKKFDPKFGRQTLSHGYITGLDGRPILVESEHMLLNYQLQSDEAIQMATAYVWLYDQAHKHGWVWGVDWAYCIWYHDEYQIECRPEIAEELKDLAEEAIAWAGRYYKIACLHEGDAKIGMNWKETH